MKLKTLLKPVVTLLTVTALMGALLAGVNFATRDAIAQAKAQKTARAIAAVLPGAAAPEVISFEDDTALVQTVYRTDLGYAVETAPAGFGGSIALMVGVDPSGTVLGVSVISHAETPGLGAVAAAKTAAGEAFRSQFAGQTPLAVKQDGGSLDAITGATVTSRAIAQGVNAAAQCVLRLEGAA